MGAYPSKLQICPTPYTQGSLPRHQAEKEACNLFPVCLAGKEEAQATTPPTAQVALNLPICQVCGAPRTLSLPEIPLQEAWQEKQGA